MKEQIYDVIVVGGGAAGLMAAIWAAKEGAHTAILDHHTVSGKKILATGNGKCNFTNELQGESCYRSDSPAFVLHILKQFSEKDTVAFFEELGVLSKSRQGYLYPRSGQAATIRNALLSQAEQLGIVIFQEIGIRKIQRKENGFVFDTKNGTFQAKSCILATGGKAAPKTGSDGSGYIYAKSFGHQIETPLPALTALYADAKWLKQTSGVRADATVSLFVENQCVAEDTGEVQFADYGISGIPVFQVSRYASIALAQRQSVRAELDFIPDYPEEQIEVFLSKQIANASVHESWQQLLSGIVNEKLAGMLCAGLHAKHVSDIPEKRRPAAIKKLMQALKRTTLTITDTRGFDFAQVTCGGVPLNELTEEMESRLVSGLYFAGEVVNVDGICGGYNLQWAWSSGTVAGKNAAKQAG